jgi:DNA mismatch endonuclease (patch repair protein)
VDTVPRGIRRRMMQAVKRRDTQPELRLRSALHRIGLRFRVCRRDLPGSPDIVLPKHELAIFVHGCYWHRHSGCSRTTTPKSNQAFWNEKFIANVARDARNRQLLQGLGWTVIEVWECEITTNEKAARVAERVVSLLETSDG